MEAEQRKIIPPKGPRDIFCEPESHSEQSVIRRGRIVGHVATAASGMTAEHHDPLCLCTAWDIALMSHGLVKDVAGRETFVLVPTGQYGDLVNKTVEVEGILRTVELRADSPHELVQNLVMAQRLRLVGSSDVRRPRKIQVLEATRLTAA